MSEESLRSRTVSGMLWNGFQRFGVMGITFISNLILSRILDADDFGCMAILLVFIALSNTFVDGGFGSALIQKLKPTNEDYSTIFFWNLFLSIVLFAMLFFASPWIAAYYEMPILDDTLKVSGLILIFNALGMIQNNQMRKYLQFKKIASINVSAMSIAALISIWAAYKGMGVWSLVIIQLGNSVFSSIFYWIFSNWRPMLVFRKDSFKELFGFGGFILLSSLVIAISNNIQALIIGKMFNAKTLGYFTQARRLEELPAYTFSSIIGQVSYSVFSQFQHDRERLSDSLQKSVRMLSFANFPIMILLLLIAEPLIIFLYTDKWVQSIPYFQILCVGGLAACLQDINSHAVAALGKSKILFMWSIIKRSINILFLLGGLLFGMKGLLFGMVLGSFNIYIVNAILASRFTDYKLLQQLKDISVTLIIACVSAVVPFLVFCYIDLGNLATILLQSVMYCMVYLGLARICKVEAYPVFVGLVKESLLTKFRKG